jgi:predicted kinase
MMVNMIATPTIATNYEVKLYDLHQHTNLTESAPTLVLMAGFAGAGKTTLAKRLSYWLQWEVLNKDVLKLERLARGEEEEPAGWHAFEDLFRHIEKKVVGQGKSVIIDTSNERPFIFENVQQVLEQLRCMHIYAQLQVILCVATKETRTKRLNKRGSVFAPYVQKLPMILDDAELPERFKHLPADKVQIVNTNPPLSTYDWKVLKALQVAKE